MARIGTKPPVLSSASLVGSTLDQLSKAALIDSLCEAISLLEGSGGEPVTLEQAREFIEPTLMARGDKWPTPPKPLKRVFTRGGRVFLGEGR